MSLVLSWVPNNPLSPQPVKTYKITLKFPELSTDDFFCASDSLLVFLGVYSLSYIFSRGCHRLHLFPRFSSVSHVIHVFFPRLSPVTCFPHSSPVAWFPALALNERFSALVTRYMSSCICYLIQDFSRLR